MDTCTEKQVKRSLEFTNLGFTKKITEGLRGGGGGLLLFCLWKVLVLQKRFVNNYIACNLIYLLIITITKFSNLIGYHQP